MLGSWQVENRGSLGLRTRGFVWASKREAENGHTETRSYFADFCLAKVRRGVREGLVYNRACAGGFLVDWCLESRRRSRASPGASEQVRSRLRVVA